MKSLVTVAVFAVFLPVLTARYGLHNLQVLILRL